MHGPDAERGSATTERMAPTGIVSISQQRTGNTTDSGARFRFRLTTGCVPRLQPSICTRQMQPTLAGLFLIPICSPMSPILRKRLLWLHTWSGLTIGVFILFLALTAAGMVMRPTLARVLYSDLHVVDSCEKPRPLDALAEQARAAHPADLIVSVEMKTDPTESVGFKFGNKDLVYLDPCSARVLGTQNMYSGVFGASEWLHRLYFLPDRKPGLTLMGWVDTICLVLLVMGGLVLWWPRNRLALFAALKFNPRLPEPARTLNLHRVVGIYTAIALLVMTFTALPLAFDTVKRSIYDAAGYVPKMAPRSTEPPEGTKRMSMDAFWHRTQALVPGIEQVSLFYPDKKNAAFEARFVTKDSPHTQAKGYFFMDAYTGETLRLDDYAKDQQLGRKIYLYLLALHTGAIWGLPYQLLLLAGVLGAAVQTYSGVVPYLRRKLGRQKEQGLTLVLARRSQEPGGVAVLEFRHPKGLPLPSFTAGAHIELQLGTELRRSYSLCNAPLDKLRYVIAVQLHPASRGGSRAVHQNLKVGDRVRTSLPRNHFPLDMSASHSILLAGGIGITPIMAMAHHLDSVAAPFELHYCTRSPQHAAFMDALSQPPLARRVTHYFSDSVGGSRIDLDATLRQAEPGTHVYACGPERFMDAVAEAARRNGWSDGQIHREHFQGGAFTAENNAEFEVQLVRSGKVVRVPKDRTVVQALAASGVVIPVSCGAGVCGTCVTRVCQGVVEHRDKFLSEMERLRNDRFMPCCSRASGKLVLDL